MRLLKNKDFWIGAVAGVLIVNVALPRFAPQIRAKIPV
jgi:hypothetical protein